MIADLQMRQHPPEQLFLAEDEVHLWRLELDQPEAVVRQLSQTLSIEESARAQRLRSSLVRRRFITGRGLLRVLLARYARTHPAALVFSYGVYEKPFLAGPQLAYPLYFNLSHSGGLGLVAVGRGGEVGVDLEQIHPVPEMAVIAERYFSPQEREALMALPEDQRQIGFFNCWTRKEACLKAAGAGFNYPLDRFTVSLRPEEPAALLEASPPLESLRRWRLHHLPLENGYAAALACDASVRRIVYRRMDDTGPDSGSF